MSEKLQHAAATLASMCDGANSRDGCGYNKIDKDFGYWLASSDRRTWGNDTQCRAWRMLRKYRGQLEASGLTLTKSSNTFFIELDWTPAAHDQAEDRVHRIGQESDTVNAWYMLADESIDQTIYSLIEKKRGIARQVTDGVAVEAEASILNELIDSLVK